MSLFEKFLTEHGCDVSDAAVVSGDWSPRTFYRLRRYGQDVIALSCAPDDSPDSLPGHKLKDFIRIASYLKNKGIHVPDVYAVDEGNGFALLEDFGDVSFKKSGCSGKSLYTMAIDVLISFRDNIGKNDLKLPSYYEGHIHKGRQRVVDWYLPFVNEGTNSDGLVQDYLSVWDDIEQSLSPCPQGFVHGDYHFENLMYLADEKECGVLDFQGALWGPLPYDLVNLLEDIRVDVPQSIQDQMFEQYCTGIEQSEKELFSLWYRVLGTQFHCRIMGQMIRLAVLDKKTSYLDFMPRVAMLLKKGLETPVLAPMKKWFTAQGIHFDKIPQKGDLQKLAEYIREDAF